MAKPTPQGSSPSRDSSRDPAAETVASLVYAPPRCLLREHCCSIYKPFSSQFCHHISCNTKPTLLTHSLRRRRRPAAAVSPQWPSVWNSGLYPAASEQTDGNAPPPPPAEVVHHLPVYQQYALQMKPRPGAAYGSRLDERRLSAAEREPNPFERQPRAGCLQLFGVLTESLTPYT